MKKLLLVSSTLYAMTVLAAAGFAAGQPSRTVLWNQNDRFGSGIPSDNCTVSSSCSAVAADDFVIPTGQRWYVQEIDVTGSYDGGQASSENVVFYGDVGGAPGPVVKAYNNIVCKDSSGNFSCDLGKYGLKLKGGGIKHTRYWVSVVANCYGNGGCEGKSWQWTETTRIRGVGAEWDYGDGWKQIGDDLAFTLKGRN